MKQLISTFILSFIVVFYTATASAEKIKGVGLSQSAAGTDFNYSIANSNAMTFLADQLTTSYFTYRKGNNNFTITRTLKGKVGKITDKDITYLSRNGVAVILETDAKVPSHSGASCYKNKYKIRSAKDLQRMMPGMLKASVIKLVKSKYKNRKQFSGLLYIKDLSIYKWRAKGKYTIRASVCMANVK